MIKFFTPMRPLNWFIVWPTAPMPRALARPLPALYAPTSCHGGLQPPPACEARDVRPPSAAFMHGPPGGYALDRLHPRGDMANQLPPPG